MGRQLLNRTHAKSLACAGLLAFALHALAPANARAGCGATTNTWTGASTTAWALNANWSAGTWPNTSADNTFVVATARVPRASSIATVGCLTITSGNLIASTNAITLTVAGDYFRNLTAGGLTVTAGRTFKINMSSTVNQTFENVDPINYLVVTNTTVGRTVTLTQPFTIRNQLDLSGMTTGTVYIDDTVIVDSASTLDLVIPAGVTLEVRNGGQLRFLAAGRTLTVNGTLKIGAGSTVQMGSATTVAVSSTGLLDLAGSNGNIARLEAASAGTSFSLNVAGTVQGTYFIFNRTSAPGLNVTGTISSLSNGEFHNPPASGYGITLGAAANIPATLDSLSFYNDSSAASVRNFNASAYNVSDILLTNWAGDTGGAANENDPNGGGLGRVNWGTQAPVALSVSNSTAAGNPPTTLAAASADTLLVTYGASLNQATAATDIQNVTLTFTGTANASEIKDVKIYKDAAGSQNCNYDVGVDTQVGSTLYPVGNPPTVDFAFGAGDVAPNSGVARCFHVLISTSAIAQPGLTIQTKILATADMTNSQGYSFSSASGPPVSSGVVTITGTAAQNWDGATSTSWGTATNWTSAVPTNAIDCDVGVGTRVPNINIAAPVCRHARFLTGGTLNSSAATNILSVYGNLETQSGYTFNAPYFVYNISGANNQSVKFTTAAPYNVTVANTGAANNNTVGIDSNSMINGSLTLTSGILKINDGVTLTLGGNLTINGGTLEIAPGGILSMANGTTITLTSGTLKMIGTSSQTAKITATSGSYTLTANGGTVQAQYYTLDRLGTNGFTINAGATIDATYHLQNGSFTYPVNNNSTFLRLFKKVPPGDTTETLAGMTFDASGSGATGTKNICTDSTIGAGTLSITSYSGSLGGPTYEGVSAGCSGGASTYALAWSGASNTIDITQESTTPLSMNAGSTYTMGRFGFKQTLAGASYVNTDISTLKLTLTGTGSASDVAQARIYYDSACAGTGGVLIGTQTFSGSPASATFSGISGATVQADLTTPPKRCVYVDFDIDPGAANAATLGVKIAAATDTTNSQSYAVSGSTSMPVTLGTAGAIVGSSNTTWTGSSTTVWETAANWSAGVPTATTNCIIGTAARNPVISAAGALCKSMTISSGGVVTMTNGTGAVLQIYGSFSNAGTLTQNDGVIRIRDDAITATDQTITSTNTITALTFLKTAAGGGKVKTGGNLTVTNQMTIPTGSTFTWQVLNGHTLTLSNGLIVQAGTMDVQGGGILRIGNGQTLSVTGGTFKISGTNDVYDLAAGTPSLSNKGKVTVAAAGTWTFSATSGTVDLVGFILDYLDVNGLNISGSTTLSNMRGGQFAHLVQDFATPVKAIQLNTSGSVPATADNVGFMFDDANSYPAEAGWCNCAPTPAQSYYLVYAPACGGGTLTFDQWFGDFYNGLTSPTTEAKIHDADDGAGTCQIAMAASSSPVSLASFGATPYNAKIVLDWRTVTELDHAGFNVYRSYGQSPSSIADPRAGYAQINTQLVRNILSTASAQGLYRFVDEGAINGISHSYYIEDVAMNGNRTLHGPISATPLASLGAPGATPGGTNNTTNLGSTGTAPSGGGGPIAAPGAVDLGGGVKILSQTDSTLRIEILPPAASFAASDLAGYETVAMAGYSSMLAPGLPELPERTVLVPIGADKTSAAIAHTAVTTAALGTRQIAPAPSWALNGSNQLVPTQLPDPAAYVSAVPTPAAHYELDSQIKAISGRKYLLLVVRPLSWVASSGVLTGATRIVLDVTLDGASLAPSAPPASALALSPSAVEGSLRIRFQRTGLYEFSYDDLVAAGVDAPFAGAPIADLRMYASGLEIPIELNAAGGAFASGDKIRFHAIHFSSLEDTESEVVLARIPLGDSTGAALRMSAVDGDPSGLPGSDEYGTFAQVSAQEDWMPIFDIPLGAGKDHYYWNRLFEIAGSPQGEGVATKSFAIDLPEHLRSANSPVKLRVALRGRGGYAVNPTHHLGVWINTVPFRVADAEFSTQDATVLEFSLPPAIFVAGANTVKLQAIGDRVSLGDYDIIDVDRIEIDYTAARSAIAGVATVVNRRPDTSLVVDGFSTSQIAVYDVTKPERPARLSAVSIGSGANGFQASFGARYDGDLQLGLRFVAVESGSALKPTGLALAHGSEFSLRTLANAADLLVIGRLELLASASELITARESQGLRVIAVTPEQVFAEFSHGRFSSQAIRDLVRFSRSWAAAPKYLLLLGDGSLDPKNTQGYNPPIGNLPIPLEGGNYIDFGSDHWFVAQDDGSAPLMAIGRIPTSDPAQVSRFVRKLLDYESGSRAPTGDQAKKLVFVADFDRNGERFADLASRLSSSALSSQPAFVSSTLDRTTIGTDNGTRAQLTTAMRDGALMVTYIGHGADDRWSDGILTTAQVAAIANDRLPMVLALNCQNANFALEDPAYESLGEKMLLDEAGAVAFIGSTSMTHPIAQQRFAAAVLTDLGAELAKPAHDVRLGDVWIRAKASTGESPSTVDTIRSFTLLGDPSMRIPATAFTGVASTPSQPTSPEAEEQKEDGGSGFGCATVQGPRGGGGPGAFLEFAALLLACATAYAASRRPRFQPIEK